MHQQKQYPPKQCSKARCRASTRPQQIHVLGDNPHDFKCLSKSDQTAAQNTVHLSPLALRGPVSSQKPLLKSAHNTPDSRVHRQRQMQYTGTPDPQPPTILVTRDVDITCLQTPKAPQDPANVTTGIMVSAASVQSVCPLLLTVFKYCTRPAYMTETGSCHDK